ncbi:protein CASP [Vigna unguiculata]|uniref:protein CASP n=1 Tax=Vigna unguiculata TaxID=3917 RepID=UPI0010166E42|nr:protein CASP [Vigna unguiculata]
MEAPLGGSGSGPERDKSTAPPSSSPISVVSAFWKDFELEKEKTVLDEQGLRIAENQENSQKNRRKLAENTRDFKKASPEDKLSLFSSLLKGYQEEVDNLTKRAKFGENAFLNIYQKLYEAPDPYPALVSIAEQDLKLSELESENRKMKVELEEFRTEATHLKNQQATIRRLEERNRQLEQQMEEKVKEIVEIKQRSLAEENQKTLEVLKEREQALQDQLQHAKDSVSNMQKLHEIAQNQLFELRAQSEEERAAKQSEVTILMDEVERAQTTLLSLEREKGLLRSQLQTANEGTETKNSDSFDSTSALENSLNAKEKQISELNLELHNIETTLSNEREEHMNDVKKLTAMLNEKEAALEEMKKELQARPTEKTVDDLRKKVKILQAVGYNSIEAEDWEVATSGEEMSKMEFLLLDKNRKMEHELTQLKVSLSEKTSLLETAEEKIAELTTKVNEQQKLIQKLEDDILKGYSSNSKDRKGNFLDDWDLSDAGGAEASENTDQRQVSLDQDQSSMLKVICNQRDRFRNRLRETEEEIRQLKEKIGILTVELEKSKADNVKLYGKMRYVQDYNIEKVVSRGSKKYAEDIESGFSSDVESKYKKIYEDDINPFAAFSKKERDQRYKELGFRDRITLSSGRFLLGNKYARAFAFFYTIGLHVLVFTCLYRMSALSYLSNGPEEFLVGEKNVDLPRGL